MEKYECKASGKKFEVERPTCLYLLPTICIHYHSCQLKDIRDKRAREIEENFRKYGYNKQEDT